MGSVRGFRIASILFFASGATGLAYEVIWFRRFAHIWGASTPALGAVVASFLLGLGIGARWLGPVADRVNSPLKGYALCELGIGLFALLIPAECSLLAGLSGALYPFLQGIPLLHALVRLVLTFLVIGPPCVLMGGTFPLLVRQFTPAGDEAGPSAGWLYAVNTGGAALGCYAAGFHLLPSLGLSGTNVLAASVNLGVALAAFLLARALRPQSAAVSGSAAPAPATAGRTRALLAASALTGAASLLLQMVWTRQLCVMLGGSTYALSATLFVILLGIGLGSLLFRATIRRLADPARVGVWVLALLVLSTGAAKMLIPTLTVAVGLSGVLRSMELGNAAVCIAAGLALELVPSLCMGFVFPLLVHLTRRGAADAGRAVGSIYAWNTLGSIVGAAATAPLGLALLGSGLTMALGLGLFLVAAALVAPLDGRRAAIRLAVAGGLAAAGIWLGAVRLNPLITDEGMFLYGYRDTSRRSLLYFREGASCNVTVTEAAGDRALSVNGKVDATKQGDMDMQLGIACFPRFLRPRASNVLVIGFGSGSTAGASLLFPGTRVTCCEIEPAVYRASTYFSEVNHSPERQKGFSIVFDDGRSHLQGTRETYDLILSEPSNPWLAGVSSLFTREFYQTCRKRLGDAGVLAQWIQLYSFSETEYALVVRTVLETFPHACLIRVSGSDSILLASPAKIVPTREDLDASQSIVSGSPELQADLQETFRGSDVRSLLLTRLILDEEGLRRVAAAGAASTVNTDLNLRLEFDAPLRLFRSDYNPEDDMDPVIVKAMDGEWIGRLVDGWGCTKTQVPALRWLAEFLRRKQREALAVELLDRAVRLDPDDMNLLAEKLISMKWTDSAALEAATRILVERAPEEAVRVGAELWRVSQYKLAAQLFERLTARHPRSAAAWKNLGMNYERLGEWEKGEAAWRTALELEPLDATLKKDAAEFRHARELRKK